jgi:hypothetical protein
MGPLDKYSLALPGLLLKVSRIPSYTAGHRVKTATTVGIRKRTS